MTRETEREIFDAAAKRLGWEIEEIGNEALGKESYYRFFYATTDYTGKRYRACHAIFITYADNKVHRGTFYNDNGPDHMIRTIDRRSTKLAAAMSWLEDVSNKYEPWK